MSEQVLEHLTVKEKRVMEQLIQGKKNAEISASLDISLFDVDYRLRRVFKKLQVDNRVSAAVRFTVALIDNNVRKASQ